MKGSGEWGEEYVEYSEAFEDALRHIVTKALSFDPLVAAVACSELYPTEQVAAGSFAGWQLRFEPIAGAAHFACVAAWANFRNQRGGRVGRYFSALKSLLPLKHGVGTAAQRHFAVYHFLRLEFFDGEPDKVTMQPFVNAFSKQLGVDIENPDA